MVLLQNIPNKLCEMANHLTARDVAHPRLQACTGDSTKAGHAAQLHAIDLKANPLQWKEVQQLQVSAALSQRAFMCTGAGTCESRL
jgi:hypothetical protein